MIKIMNDRMKNDLNNEKKEEEKNEPMDIINNEEEKEKIIEKESKSKEKSLNYHTSNYPINSRNYIW